MNFPVVNHCHLIKINTKKIGDSDELSSDKKWNERMFDAPAVFFLLQQSSRRDI